MLWDKLHSASPRGITFLLIHNSCNYFQNCTRIRVIIYMYTFLFCTVFHHWGECSSVSELSAGIEGNWLPSGLRGRQTSSGDAPAIIKELCYPGNHCLLWAQPGLPGGQDTKVGPLQVQQSKQGRGNFSKNLYESFSPLSLFSFPTPRILYHSMHSLSTFLASLSV